MSDSAARAPRFASPVNVLGITLIHAATVWALVRGADVGLVALAVGSYFVRMFAITAGYHRYFAHRAFKTSRAFQLVLALVGTSATQKGPLWWSAVHRIHHRWSDTPKDVHSPKQRGFFWSHMGWWLSSEHEETRLDLVPDFAKYPEIRFVDRYHWIGVAIAMALPALLRGFDGFLWGYVVSTCALLHGTFTINSLSHVFGSRRYETNDTSRNNLWLALVTMGEGWHNNHHHYPNSANQGFFWWELDASYYLLRLLASVGVVWDLRSPPRHVLEARPVAARAPAAPAAAASPLSLAPRADAAG